MATSRKATEPVSILSKPNAIAELAGMCDAFGRDAVLREFVAIQKQYQGWERFGANEPALDVFTQQVRGELTMIEDVIGVLQRMDGEMQNQHGGSDGQEILRTES